MSTEELVGFLEDRGADTSGDKEDLVERLADLFAPELDRWDDVPRGAVFTLSW